MLEILFDLWSPSSIFSVSLCIHDTNDPINQTAVMSERHSSQHISLQLNSTLYNYSQNLFFTFYDECADLTIHLFNKVYNEK